MRPFFFFSNAHVTPPNTAQQQAAAIMLSRVVLAEVSGPAIRHSHSHTRKRYHSTIDQAREYATELGPDMASAFDELSHKTALVLRAYVAAVCQEGHSYSETEAIRDAMKQYFEDTFGCRGADWKFVPDRDEYSFMDEANDEERGHWTGNPVFDPVFVSTMQELKAQEERSQGARQAKRRTAIGYEDMAKFMLHLQKPTTIKAEGEGHCLFFQAFAATAFTLWLTYVHCFLRLAFKNINNFNAHTMILLLLFVDLRRF